MLRCVTVFAGAKQATTPKLRAKCDEGADRVSLLQSLWAAFTSAAFLAPYIVNQLGSVAATASMTWLREKNGCC